MAQEVGEVYRTMGAADKLNNAVQQTYHDITPEFGERVIGWFGRYLVPDWPTASAPCCTTG